MADNGKDKPSNGSADAAAAVAGDGTAAIASPAPVAGDAAGAEANAAPTADVERQRRRATIVMLSGGLDSVYTMVKLLRETDDEILAHHINLIDPDRRFVVEAKRCRSIVDYCRQNYRDFTFSTSTVDHVGFRFLGFDMVTVGFEAGIVAHSYFEARGRMPDRWTVGTCKEEGVWEERFHHVQACCTANCFPERPPRFYLLPLIPKHAEMDYLPPELLDLSWSCRAPIIEGDTVQECGECHTCKDLAAARAKRRDRAGAAVVS